MEIKTTEVETVEVKSMAFGSETFVFCGQRRKWNVSRMYYAVQRHISTYYDVLRRVTMYYKVLQHITAYHDVLRLTTTNYDQC